ncbi:integrator complex subunit 6 [Sarcoptes scabiei]|nr:integrator complex subunit 6 [Sarcoptes scabiei]
MDKKEKQKKKGKGIRKSVRLLQNRRFIKMFNLVIQVMIACNRFVCLLGGMNASRIKVISFFLTARYENELSKNFDSQKATAMSCYYRINRCVMEWATLNKADNRFTWTI